MRSRASVSPKLASGGASGVGEGAAMAGMARREAKNMERMGRSERRMGSLRGGARQSMRNRGWERWTLCLLTAAAWARRCGGDNAGAAQRFCAFGVPAQNRMRDLCQRALL